MKFTESEKEGSWNPGMCESLDVMLEKKCYFRNKERKHDKSKTKQKRERERSSIGP